FRSCPWIICVRKSSPISWYCFFSGGTTALSTISPALTYQLIRGRASSRPVCRLFYQNPCGFRLLPFLIKLKRERARIAQLAEPVGRLFRMAGPIILQIDFNQPVAVFKRIHGRDVIGKRPEHIPVAIRALFPGEQRVVKML